MKYEIVRGVLESKNGLREIILSKKAEDGLLINTPIKAMTFALNEEGKYIPIIATGKIGEELDARKEGDFLYLSVLKDEVNEIYQVMRVANEKIYEQYSNLLDDYNLGKIDVLYNDKSRSLLEAYKSDTPSIDWDKELEKGEIEYER